MKELADPLLGGDFPVRALNQAVAVAAMCLNEEAAARPLISDVVTALSFLGAEATQSSPSSYGDVPAPLNDHSPINPSKPKPKPRDYLHDDNETAEARQRAVAEAIEWGSSSRQNAAASRPQSCSSL